MRPCRPYSPILRLTIKFFRCPCRIKHHDRDANAAMNIRDKGLKDLEDMKSVSGCGMQSDLKQKRVKASTSGKSRKALAKLSP